MDELKLCFYQLGHSHKPKLLGMHNVTVQPGGTARLDCSLHPQEHQVANIDWFRLIGTIDPSGAPYAEALEVIYKHDP